MAIKEKKEVVIDPTDPKSPWFLEILERAKAHGDRKQVEFWNPKAAAKAMWLLAQGNSYKSIQRDTKLDRQTIRALEWRHNDTLETKRKEFSMKYAIAAEEFTDLLFKKAEQLADNPEQLENISPDKLALTVGIMTDKATQLAGMAGVVIEHRQGASISDAAKMISEARSRLAKKASGAIIDVTA